MTENKSSTFFSHSNDPGSKPQGFEKVPNKKFAGYRLRLLAHIIDSAILFIPLSLLLWFAASSVTLPEFMQRLFLLFILWLIPFFAINTAHDTFFTHWYGGTIGKLLVGLRVTDENGNLLSFKRSFFRHTVGYQFAFLLLGLGFMTIIKDSKKQGWHDKAVGSIVVVQNNQWALALLMLLLALALNFYIFYSAFNIFFSGTLPQEFKSVINSLQIEKGNKTIEKVYKGTVLFTDIEGGCWYLLVDAEQNYGAIKYELIGIEKSHLEQYRNKKVEISGNIKTDTVSICQIGPILEVEKIKLLEETKQTDIDISSWQTYRNDEFGFEVEHPQVWKVVDLEKEGALQIYLPIPSNSFTPKGIGSSIVIDYKFDEFTNNREKGLTLEEWVNSSEGRKIIKGVPQKIPIGNLEGYGVDITNQKSDIYIMDKEKRVYYISTNSYNNQDIKTLYKILSTFRFVK